MDIKALHRQGFNYSEIGRMVGRDWRTVKRYLTEGVQPSYKRKRMPSSLDPLKPVVDQMLAREPRLLASRIHQDLVLDYGYTGSYDVVRRYVKRSRPRTQEVPAERFETAPGHQAQVDWSHESPIATTSGIELPLYGFHMTLGHSRDSFCALVGSMDLVTFWACHRAAFSHFGGVPKEILYDRTKTVVKRHVGRHERTFERHFHPEALASATHYGFTIRLCKAYRPQTKGKVESDVFYVRERLLRGHSFASYDDANVRWLAWNDAVARARRHATHGEIVAERALRDRAALLPAPPYPYLVVERTTRAVARDGFFSFEGQRYIAPHARPGERVELTLGKDEIEVRRGQEIVARHARRRPGQVALPDPQVGSVTLASVLGQAADHSVRSRPIALYEEVVRG